MKIKRKIVEIDEEKCDGCGQCVPSCAEGAIQIVNGKARLFSEKYCDGLGACLGECPNDALRVVEREAEDFDEMAVEEHLQSREAAVEGATMACGCPSAHIQSFASPTSREGVSKPVEGGVSTLSHWPVQIRLVPATAPFLKGADLLVAADCTPVAYPNFHQDFLKAKVILVGCPKLDDAEDYVQRFADIFRTADIKSVTVVAMEVPCCQGLPVIVKKGMELAGRKIPIDQVTIGIRGDVLKRERLAVVDFLLKKKERRFKRTMVYIDEEECIGCGTCEEICPEVFKLRDEIGKAEVINPEGGAEDLIEEAISSCPVSCIRREE